jgi:hypothetical protein
MALTFAATNSALQSWGISAGDIAVLAGAGRAVGTWVMNKFKDEALLQFMRVDPEDLIPRRGLIDPSALHQRWDVRIRFTQGGDVRVISQQSKPVIDSMGSFSWLMTLIAAAMDATLSKTDIRTVTSQFLIALFEEHVDGLDYLQRELPQHIQGWMSAAAVRNLLTKSRTEWQSLLDRKLTLPGNIPSNDVPELVRFLTWVTGAKSQKGLRIFKTSSSDVICFAHVLASIGFDTLEVCDGDRNNEPIESKLLVKFTPEAVATERIVHINELNPLFTKCKRPGMRVPIDFPEECVSLWPGSATNNNNFRQLFKTGLACSATLKITVSLPERARRPQFQLSDSTHSSAERMEPLAYRLVSALFPIPTPKLIDQIGTIVRQFPDWASTADDESVLFYAQSHPLALSKLQVFVLGYYYGMMRKVLDTSRLAVAEVYGSWTWFDAHLLYRLSDILAEHCTPDSAAPPPMTLKYEGLLQLLAIFVAGAEEQQWTLVNDSTFGLHGKLTVLASCLLGIVKMDSADGWFCVLDTDSTAIPSNARGLIGGGIQNKLVNVTTTLSETRYAALARVNPRLFEDDFTSHIEPDWDNDVQQCQVVFRYRGRLVRRFAPETLELAWTAVADTALKPDQDDPILGQNPNPQASVWVAVPEDIARDGWPAPTSDDTGADLSSPYFFPTMGLVKARTCLLTEYYLKKYLRVRVSDVFFHTWAKSAGKESSKSNTSLLVLHPNTPGASFKTGKCVILG